MSNTIQPQVPTLRNILSCWNHTLYLYTYIELLKPYPPPLEIVCGTQWKYGVECFWSQRRKTNFNTVRPLGPTYHYYLFYFYLDFLLIFECNIYCIFYPPHLLNHQTTFFYLFTWTYTQYFHNYSFDNICNYSPSIYCIFLIFKSFYFKKTKEYITIHIHIILNIKYIQYYNIYTI